MPKVHLPKKSQKTFASEINILRSGKTTVLTKDQEQTLREDKEALNGVLNRLRQSAKSAILLIASTKHSSPDFPIIKSIREEIFSAKAMVATHISDLESRLERQQLAKSFLLAKELEAKEQSAKMASARVLRDHDKKLKAANQQTRLMVREGEGGPSWTLSRPRGSGNTSTHPLAVPEPKLKPYKRRGVLTSTPTSSTTTSTPATTSSTSSSGSTDAPRKAVPYVSRTGRRRSPRLREKRERQAAQDANLIKRYGLKRLSVVVERLPAKQSKWPLAKPATAAPVPDGRDYRQTKPPASYNKAEPMVKVEPVVKAEPLDYVAIPGPLNARSKPLGPEVALPILDGVIDQVLQQVTGEVQEAFPGPPIDWSFDPESPSFIPILSPARIPSPDLRQVERSNGVIEVFEMGESPIDQARMMEANPIVPQTPDPTSYRPAVEVIPPPPAVVQAADSTISRPIPLIILDDDEQAPPVIEIIELE